MTPTYSYDPDLKKSYKKYYHIQLDPALGEDALEYVKGLITGGNITDIALK